MNGDDKVVTNRTPKSWLAMGSLDRGVSDGLTFVTSGAAVSAGARLCRH